MSDSAKASKERTKGVTTGARCNTGHVIERHAPPVPPTKGRRAAPADAPAVRVTMLAEDDRDPGSLRWLGHWLRRLLNAQGTPDEGGRT